MPYVRDRMRVVTKDRARERSEFYRQMLEGDPAALAGQFGTALDWMRAAAVYALRRGYPDTVAASAAHARRAEILAAAAALIQEHAGRIDREVPSSFRRKTRRPEFREAYSRAETTAERLDAARAWFMFIARQAERLGGKAAEHAERIEGECASRLIEWAKEMDADDYGQ
jgi:hypothetical protein